MPPVLAKWDHLYVNVPLEQHRLLGNDQQCTCKTMYLFASLCCATPLSHVPQWAIVKSNFCSGQFNCVRFCGFHGRMIFSE